MGGSASGLEALDMVIEDLGLRPDSPLLAPLKRARNNYSLLCRFPPEIICHIISLAKDDFGWPTFHAAAQHDSSGGENQATGALGAKYNVKLGWVVLSHICSLWREVALGAPQLWTDPSDYFALPPVLSRLIRERARDVPFHLELTESSLRRLRQVGCKVLLPAASIPIATLQVLDFSVANFGLLDHGYFRIAPFGHLRQLVVSVVLAKDSVPVLLPIALTSSPYMEHVDLHNCLPSRWDVPMFGPRLIDLSLWYTGEPEVRHLMPSTLEFSHLLASTTALQSLSIHGIHLQGPAFPYPSMLMSPALRSLDVSNWLDAHDQHRDCLIFLGNIVLQRPNVHMEISLDDLQGDADDGTVHAATVANDIPSLIRSALHNIFRQQQSPPKQIVLDRKTILTLHSETHETSPLRAWSNPATRHMYAATPEARSLLNFDFDLVAIDDASFLYEGVVPVPLHRLHRVSLNTWDVGAYLESKTWWRAMGEAVDVHCLDVYFGDCAKLLPLVETVSKGGVAVFASFPNLKVIHVHLDEPDDESDEAGAVNMLARNLATLQAIVDARQKHVEESRLESLVVDSALSDWTIWETFAVNVSVSFHDFTATDVEVGLSRSLS
ncbi:unnamed protein product [Peniophora sp. CBMAI 1063]|nr:unnamed protein product [Peniophora sp. CBMAI 1063]